MKLPFNVVISPLIKPYLGRTRVFCQHPLFSASIPYTYLYSSLGFLISVNHLRRHLGEAPPVTVTAVGSPEDLEQDTMLVHDLKIIATSMGLVQYACLLVGCLSENPALFLPHLTGQLIVVIVKIINAMLLLMQFNSKSAWKLRQKIPAIILLGFNWLQEFCVFRQFLCICDL